VNGDWLYKIRDDMHKNASDVVSLTEDRNICVGLKAMEAARKIDRRIREHAENHFPRQDYLDASEVQIKDSEEKRRGVSNVWRQDSMFYLWDAAAGTANANRRHEGRESEAITRAWAVKKDCSQREKANQQGWDEKAGAIWFPINRARSVASKWNAMRFCSERPATTRSAKGRRPMSPMYKAECDCGHSEVREMRNIGCKVRKVCPTCNFIIDFNLIDTDQSKSAWIEGIMELCLAIYWFSAGVAMFWKFDQADPNSSTPELIFALALGGLFMPSLILWKLIKWNP
jgi:hypothetical protein